jgi:hypothetical protein
MLPRPAWLFLSFRDFMAIGTKLYLTTHTDLPPTSLCDLHDCTLLGSFGQDKQNVERDSWPEHGLFVPFVDIDMVADRHYSLRSVV